MTTDQPSGAEPGVVGSRQYWAFISYSHRDKAWADWLHRSLETYRVPSKLVDANNRNGVLPKRLYPIFRDREELPTSSNLGSVISDALLNSRYLVVICSPNSAASQWVNQEIQAFKALGKADRVLALIVDGEPNVSDKPGLEDKECFPLALRFELDADGQLSDQPAEPVAGDARPFADGKRNALLKLLAGLLGVDYALLNDREHQRRLRRMLGVGMLIFVLGISAVGLWGVQEQRRLRDLRVEHQKTLEQRDRALRNLAGIYLRDAQVSLERHHNGPALLRLEASLRSFDTLGARVVTGFALPGLVPELARWPAHQGSVTALAIIGSGNEQQLVSSGADGRVQVRRLRDLEQGADLLQVPWVSTLSAGPVGDLVAAGMEGLRRFDPLTHASVLLPEHASPGALYALSPTGSVAAALDPASGVIQVRSLEDGRVLAELAPEPPTWRPSGVMRISPDGRRLAVGGGDGSVQLWDLTTYAPAGRRRGLSTTVSALAFSPDGRLLAAGEGQFLGGPGPVMALVWDLEHSDQVPPVARIGGHSQQLEQLAFSPDGRLLASSSSADKRLALWRVADFDPELFENPRFELQPLAVLPQLDQVTALDFASAGSLLVVGDGAGQLRLLYTGGLHGAAVATGVDQVATAEHADRLALLASSEKRIRVLSASAGENLAEFTPEMRTQALAMSRDGRLVAWVEAGALLVQPVNAVSAEPLRIAVDGPMQALAFSPDGTVLAAAGPGGLQLFSPADGGLLSRWEAPASAVANVRALAFGPQDRFVASATTAALMVLRRSDWTMQPLETEGQPILDLAFAPAAFDDAAPAMLLAACQDGLVRRWRLGDWQALAPLRGQQQLVSLVDASGDGQLLAAISGAQLSLWAGSDGALLHRARMNRIGLSALGFAQDGSSLVWGSSHMKTLDALTIFRGPLTSWLDRLSLRLALGLPYRLDQSGAKVARPAKELAQQRLESVRAGRFPWPLEDAGLSEQAMAEVVAVHDSSPAPAP